MKYTVYVELSFEDKNEALKVMSLIEGIKNNTIVPSGTEKILVNQKCELWETYHDENPPKQCKRLDAVDFKQDVIEDTNKEI